MNGAIANEGVQVVKEVEGPNRYELDKEALQRILLNPALRDLPVAVISIAGTFRGGKSLMLDFFLRYLKAPRSSQLNGEWLGKDDEPLKGFHWRGGSDRDTAGIYLWPEPIITTMGEYGDKVAVLLMDTQGTFDPDTTMRENSTIFALSTLMSSVQIYNLSGNIKEDDLQYLHFFIEYGTQVSEHELKAFQALLVLVRDWKHYDHEYGYGGGRELLNKRLQFKPNQNKELLEVRQHIRSCFDKIECFLMPYPGKLVCKEAFNGCLRDIDEDFKAQLRDFVPSIFDPKHLTPKTVNGEQVTARALLVYFQKCFDTFNRDDIPEVRPIYKAMSEASMVVTVRNARELYEARMGGRVRDALSVPARLLADWHHAAEREALHCYEQKKKLGSQQDIDYHLKEFKKELEGFWAIYMTKNEEMLQKTRDLARKSYKDVVNSVCTEQARLCLHPLDLHALHGQALEAALVVFDLARDVPEHDEDEDRAALVQEFMKLYGHLCALNEQNNKGAVTSARDVYARHMSKLTLHQTKISTGLLHNHHQRALEEATAHFNTQRNRITKQQHDNYMDQLLEKIDNNFKEFENMNTNSNRLVMQPAEIKYNNLMTSALGQKPYCFHPLEIEELHKKCMDETVKEFFPHRTKTGDDEYAAELIELLETRYSELKEINEFNNEQAVDQAVGVYTSEMDKHTQSSMWTLLVVPFIKMLLSVPMNHERASELALEEFYRRRRGERKYERDEYLDKLKNKIETAYSNYTTTDITKALSRKFHAIFDPMITDLVTKLIYFVIIFLLVLYVLYQCC